MNRINNEYKGKKAFRVLCGVAFGIYMLFLLYFALVSEGFGRLVQNADYRYNLQIFQEINRFWNYREVVGLPWAVINLLGNVVCFIPFGFFIPILKKKPTGFFETGIYAFCGSLAIETMQLILKIGVFDVDDLFLNTIGGLIGFIIYYCVKKILGKIRSGRME